MKQKQIKQLAQVSFTKNDLDEKKVSYITAKLQHKDLRLYVKALQLLKQQHTVEIESAISVDEVTSQELQLRFPDKKIDYVINKSMLAGMKIIDNDLLYDYSLNNKIDRLISHMYETND